MNFLLVVCGFPQKIRTRQVATVPGRIKEPGGTILAISPISMDCTLMDHILLTPMESTGDTLEATTIHLNVLR